ncbi:MAG: hypothetical protein NZ518_07630, partial [Dehalococcoidia bacterium]|nr:hypothetical protein [Dehalococcoidia bacterium]
NGLEAAARRDALLIERLSSDLLALENDPDPSPVDATDDETALRAAQETDHALRAQLEQATSERRAARAALTEAEARQAALRVERATLETRLRELDRRRDELTREESLGNGMTPPVRAVLEHAGLLVATSRRQNRSELALSGVIGTVAELITVPTGLEAAFDAALGARSQDIVVERWRDAEAAIQLLRELGAGRATFLPLDTLAPGRRATPPRDPGVIGLAADLCVVDPRYRLIVDRLLGLTLVVEDLTVARRCLERGERGLQYVTVAGDTVSNWGAVTGGSRQARRDSVWRRRAERAAIDEERDRLERRHREVVRDEERAALAIDELRQTEAERARQARVFEEERQRTASLIARLTAQREQRQAHQTERAKRAARRAAHRAELTAQIESLRAQQAARARQTLEAQSAVAAAAERLTSAERDATALRGDDTSIGNQLAGLEATARSAAAAVERGRAAIARAEAAAERARQRARDRERERDEALAHAARRDQATLALFAQSHDLQARAREAIADLRAAEREEERLVREESAIRAELTHANDVAAESDRRRHVASVAIETLARRIEADGLAV